MILLILYKNGSQDRFSEKDLDCSKLTIMGHTNYLNQALVRGREATTYLLDNYNSINLGEVISVRIIK